MWPVSNHIYKPKLGLIEMYISATVFKMAGQHGGFHKLAPVPIYFSSLSL